MRRSQYPKVETVPRPEGWKPRLRGDESLGEWMKQTVFDKKPGDLKLTSTVLRKTTIRDRGEAKRYRPQKKDFVTGRRSIRVDRKNLGFDDRPLCFQCSKITVNRLTAAAYSDFTKVSEKLGGHHYNPHELEESARSCPLCRLFVLAFAGNFQMLLKVASPPTPWYARGRCRFKIWARSMDIESRKRKEEKNLQMLVLEWIDGRSEFITELMLFADKGSEAAVKGKISTTFHSPKLSTSTLGRSVPYLLRLCHSKHSSCRGSLFNVSSGSPYAALTETKLPSRVIVIDWEKHGKDGPFLLESAGKYGIYATLSHCWGDPTTMPKTTRLTLEENLESLGLDSSSTRERTICEAIDVCKELKIPYLWVDAFCIIQHDLDDPESSLADWEWEALDMGRIYRDSALTIAAAGASDDPPNGLYGDRLDKAQYVRIPFEMEDRKKRGRRSKRRVEEVNDDMQEHTPEHPVSSNPATEDLQSDHINDGSEIGDQDLNKSEKDDSEDSEIGSDGSWNGSWDGRDVEDDAKGFFYASLPPRDFDEEVTNSRLLTRGWVLQERLLSPRYLYFGKDQWFWQCRQLTVAEVIGFENGAMKVGADLGFSPTLLKDPIKFALWWIKIIETYSRLNFTVRSDRLVALTGLVTELQKATSVEYHHGLWTQKMYIQLLWGVSAYSNTNDDNSASTTPTTEQRSRTAPSWSWQRTRDPVSYSAKADVYEPTYDQVQQKYLDYPDLKIVRPMIDYRLKHDRSGNTTILLIRGQIREARISVLGPVSNTTRKMNGLNPDRVGPLESMAKGLYNLDYPTTPLLGVGGAFQDKEVAKCRLDSPEYLQPERCYCLRVADNRKVERGREKTYAIDFLIVIPLFDSQAGIHYRRIGKGIGTAVAVSWFAGCKATQLSII